MNNNYLKRHQENLASAKLLIYSHSHYCSSVHCSYYAVFQMLLYFHKVKDSRIYRNKDRLGNVGSHDLIIGETFAYLRKLDAKKAQHFDKQIRMLKSTRVASDYNEVYIDRTISIVAYETAVSLITLITEMLNI